MECLDKKEVLNTFIKVRACSQISNAYYCDYHKAICEHLEQLGFKYKKVNSRARLSKRFNISIIFYLNKNKYDLDNLLKLFLDILRHFLAGDDINVWEIKVAKRIKPYEGIRVRVIEYWSDTFL